MMTRLYAVLAALAGLLLGAITLFKKGESTGKQKVVSEANTEALKRVEESGEIDNDIEKATDEEVDKRLDSFMRD